MSRSPFSSEDYAAIARIAREYVVCLARHQYLLDDVISRAAVSLSRAADLHGGLPADPDTRWKWLTCRVNWAYRYELMRQGTIVRTRGGGDGRHKQVRYGTNVELHLNEVDAEHAIQPVDAPLSDDVLEAARAALGESMSILVERGIRERMFKDIGGPTAAGITRAQREYRQALARARSHPAFRELQHATA